MQLSILKKLNKASYKYLVCFIISLSICVYCSVKDIHLFKPKVVLQIKMFVHKCIELPNTLNKIVSVKEENNKLKEHITNIEKELKLIEQQHSVCTKLNQNIKKFNDIDINNIEQVLGFEQGIFNSSLMISISNDKNKEGYIVVANGLVGLITDISNNIGLVRTITDSNLFVPVKLKNGITLVVSGTNNNELISVAIKQHGKLNINIGDVLYTSGEGGMFPPNIPVAKITNVDLNKQEIKAIPIVDLTNIEFITLRKPIKMMLDI